MAPVDSRDYVLSGIYYSVLEPANVRNTMWLVNTPSKHDTLTQCWSNNGSPSATLAQHQTSTGSTPRVCWGCVRSGSAYIAPLVVLTAGGEYKPTPTRWLLNVGPASPVLASTHSALVSTSCGRYQLAGGTGTML